MKKIINSDIGRLTLRIEPKELTMGVNITLLNNGGIQIYFMRGIKDGGDISLIAHPNNWKMCKERGKRGEYNDIDNQRFTLDEIEKIMMEWV